MSDSRDSATDAMDADVSSDEEGTITTTAALQKHLDAKFGVAVHHPAGFVERTDHGLTHMLILILASREAGGVALPGYNLSTRAGIANLLRDAFRLKVRALYQPTSNTRAWTFPVNSDEADKLRSGVYRLAPNLGFVILATYGAPPKKTWAYVTPLTDNMDLDDVRKQIRTLSTVRAVDKLKRVETRDGLVTEKAATRIQWADLDLSEPIPQSVLGILRGCYVRTFRVPGSLTNLELRSLPPCVICGFTNHFYDACAYPANLASAPLLELSAPVNPDSTPADIAGPAKAPREPKLKKKSKSKKAKDDAPAGMSEKAKGKRRERAETPKTPKVVF